jgi:protoheme IX farnesyltransferase
LQRRQTAMPGGNAIPHLMHLSERGTFQSYASSALGRGAALDPTDRSLMPLAALASGAMVASLATGLIVRGGSGALSFADWPLMNGRLAPALGGVVSAMFVHRIASAGAALSVVWLAIRARTAARSTRRLRFLPTLAGALFVLQAGVGAVAKPGEAGAALAIHAWISVVILAVMVTVILSVRTLASPGLPTGSGDGAVEPSWSQRGSAYLALTKPRIIELLLVTTVPAMILAARGLPPLGLCVATLVGGSMAAGAANAINCYLDRDIDEVMRRTRGRPLPSHLVRPNDALRFGFFLAAGSFFFLAIAVNVLAASLALSAIGFYVFIYTIWLKRSSTQNIVIGGAAGAVPALVGWAAVARTVAPPAWVLFVIVFVWTPPHFWALAMRYRSDYAAAGVPMLPVVRGDEETRRQMLLYSLALFATTMLLVPVAHMGWIYLASAVVLGGRFVHLAVRLWRERSARLAIVLFRFSIVYLTLLFASIAADGLLSPR